MAKKKTSNLRLPSNNKRAEDYLELPDSARNICQVLLSDRNIKEIKT